MRWSAAVLVAQTMQGQEVAVESRRLYIELSHTTGLCLLCHLQDDVSPLDEYVAAIDDVYEYEEIDYYNNTHIGCDTYVVNFTSQSWQTREY